MRALTAEFRKLLTTRTGIYLTLFSVLLTAGITILVALNTQTTDSPSTAISGVITVGANFGYILSAILGIIGLTGEYRHQTVTPTFLSVPVRGVVVGAKLLTYLIWGAIIGVLDLVVSLAVGIPLLKQHGVPNISLSAPGVHASMWSSIVIVAIFGIIGVGLGALLRNQVAAIVGLVLYLFVIENILSAIKAVQHIYTYLPGALASALTGAIGQPTGVHLLHRAPAALLLVAYGLAFALVGAALTMRRDVT